MSTQKIHTFGLICKDINTGEDFDKSLVDQVDPDKVKYTSFKTRDGKSHVDVASTEDAILFGIKRLTKTKNGKKIIFYSEFAISKENVDGIVEILSAWKNHII